MLSVDELIKSAVEDINSENESGARRSVKDLIRRISNEQEVIRKATENIQKIRVELKAVKYSEVSGQEIVG